MESQPDKPTTEFYAGLSKVNRYYRRGIIGGGTHAAKVDELARIYRRAVDAGTLDEEGAVATRIAEHENTWEES